MKKGCLQERVGQGPMKYVWDAQMVALVGCGKKRCNRGNPPKLCDACNRRVIHLLTMGATYMVRRQTGRTDRTG